MSPFCLVLVVSGFGCILCWLYLVLVIFCVGHSSAGVGHYYWCWSSSGVSCFFLSWSYFSVGHASVLVMFRCWLFRLVLFVLLSAFPQFTSCPAGTQAASLDIAKAYRNSPIAPTHKHYIPVMWKGSIYVQHVTIKGLVTAGGRVQLLMCVSNYCRVPESILWWNGLTTSFSSEAHSPLHTLKVQAHHPSHMTSTPFWISLHL